MLLFAILCSPSSTHASLNSNLDLPMGFLTDIVGKTLDTGNALGAVLTGGKQSTLLKLLGLVPKQPGTSTLHSIIQQ